MKQLVKKNYEAPLICTEDLQVTGVLCQSDFNIEGIGNGNNDWWNDDNA